MAYKRGKMKNKNAVSRAKYGSDYMAEMLRLLDVPYATINPGSSVRGIYESLVGSGQHHSEVLADLKSRNTFVPVSFVIHSTVAPTTPVVLRSRFT